MNKYKTHYLIDLYMLFIKNSINGKRKTKSGQKLSLNAISNYKSTLKFLMDLEIKKNTKIEIPTIKSNNLRQLKLVERFFKNFEKDFLSLANDKKFMQNTIGGHLKNLKAFFNWLNVSQNIKIGLFYKQIIVVKETIPIVTLDLDRMKLLIKHSLNNDLETEMQKYCDLFVFGATVGLRFSDLYRLTKRNLIVYNRKIYLGVKSQKTKTNTKILIPDYCLIIINRYKNAFRTKARLLPYPILTRFNLKIKEMGEFFNWTELIGKFRIFKNKTKELKLDNTNKNFRFCDLISSHMMRKTAITLMLLNGIPEHIVRKVSGHSSTSIEFYKYVNYIQSYLDVEFQNHFNTLSNTTVLTTI